MTRCLWSLVVLTGVTATLSANPIVAPAGSATKPPAPSAIDVLIDNNAAEPKLTIPKSVLANLLADAGEADSNAQWAGSPSFHLIVAGAAFAATLATAGLWLVRSRRQIGGMTLLVVALAVLAGTAEFVGADIPPGTSPRQRFWPPPTPPIPAGPASFPVRVDVGQQGHAIVLTASRDQLTRIMELSSPKDNQNK